MNLSNKELQPVLEADMVVHFGDLETRVDTKIYSANGANGCGNPPVTFVTREVELKNVRKVGNGNHLRMTVRHLEAKLWWYAIAYNQGHWFEGSAEIMICVFDLMFSYEFNYYRNNPSVQMIIIDIRKLG